MQRISIAILSCFSLLCSILVAPTLSISTALAADEKAAMDRINQSLDLAEKKIDRIKPTTSENTLKNIQRQLDKEKKRLGDIPAGTPDLDDAKARLAMLQKRLDESMTVFNQAADQRAADIATLTTLQSDGRAQADDAFVRDSLHMASMMKFMQFDHPHLFKDEGPTEEYRRYAQNYPPIHERINALLAEYGKMDPRDVRQYSGPALGMLVQEGGNEFKLANHNLDKFSDEALNLASARLKVGYEKAQTALQNGSAGTLLDDADVNGAITYLDNITRIYKARPDQDPSIIASYKNLNQQANETIGASLTEAFQEIVKNNSPVANRFTSPDRATIEAMVRERWKQAYPKDKILQVRISQSDWVRRREPGWRDGILIMFDYSIVTPWVVVAEDGGLASQWGMVAEKDHTQNDEISISFGRIRTEKLDPRYTVLQNKI